MKKLLKKYNLHNDMQYYNMIVESFLSGIFSDAYAFFDEMPRRNQIQMLKAMTVGGWKSGLGEHKIANLFDRIK